MPGGNLEKNSTPATPKKRPSLDEAREKMSKIASQNAPFELIKQGERPSPYPNFFLNNLKKQWPKVCKLMDWLDKTNNPLNFSVFKLAKSPRAVVKEIQTKIESYGKEYQLSKFGIDGKYGPETADKLQKLWKNHPVDTKKQTEELPVEKESDIEKPKDPLQKVVTELTKAAKPMLDNYSKATTRLEEANLVFDIDTPLAEADYSSYMERAQAFRQDLVNQYPKIAKLDKHSTPLITKLKADINALDLNKLMEAKGPKDLMPVLKDLVQTMDEFDPEKMGLDRKFYLQLVQDEVMLSYALVVMNELIATLSYRAQVEGIDPNQLAQKIKWLNGKPESMANLVSSPADPEWEKLIEAGPYQTGLIKFERGGNRVEFNLDNNTLTVDGTKAQVELPYNAKLVKLEPMPEGGIKITGSSFGMEQTGVLSAGQMDDLIAQLASGSKDPIYLPKGVVIRSI